MIFSPILHVELLTVGRRKRYFIARVVYALVLLLVMAFCYLAAFDRYQAPTLNDHAEFAYAFFTAFSWIQLFVVLGLTPAMIAGTISVEHERKTIDYLLTTQLSDTEIALGKFAARLWSVLMQLVVGLPILSIGLTLGGVGPEQLLASFGVSLVVLIFTATLCLAISSRAARSREAITRAYLIIIAWLIVPPILLLVCGLLSQSGWPPVVWAAEMCNEPLQWLVGIHPFVQLMEIIVRSSFPSVADFETFAAAHLGASALFAISAVVGVRRFYLKTMGRSSSGLGSWRQRLQFLFGLRRRPVGERAMIWKEITALRSAINLGWAGRIAAAIIYGVALFFIGMGIYWTIESDTWTERSGSPMEWTAIVEVPMIFGLMLLLITSNAAGAVTGERERDTWITLMSTPVEAGEVVRAKLLAVLYGVRYWYLLILACWIPTAIFRPGFLVVVPFLLTLHLICALFAACMGLRCSLQSSTSLKAMGAALAIMVLGVSILPMMGTGFISIATRGGDVSGFIVSSSLPFLFCAIHPTAMALMTSEHLGRGFGSFVAGCVFWSVAYLSATVLLYQQLLVSFDQHAGRSIARFDGVSRAGVGDDGPRMVNRARATNAPAPPTPTPPTSGAAVTLDVLELVDDEPSGGSGTGDASSGGADR